MLINASSLNDSTTTVPSTRAVHGAEQHMPQRTFDTTTSSSDNSSVVSKLGSQYLQETTIVRPPDLSASDVTAKSAADSQSVTSDYSTMSSICGGQDDCHRSALVSGDLEIATALGVDSQQIADSTTVRHEVSHGTRRSQSSGNFSLAINDTAESSLCTASAMELSQDSIDSAADRSDQLSLSLSSQVSGSQISDSDDLLRTVGMADKLLFNVLVQPVDTIDQKSCNTDSSCNQSAPAHLEQFGEPSVAGSVLHSNDSSTLTVRHELNPIKTDPETDAVLDKTSCTVNSVSSEKRDICGVEAGNDTSEVFSVDAEPTVGERDQVTPSEQKTDSKIVSPANSDAKETLLHSFKEQFVHPQHRVHRLVRRHTLCGTGDLAIRVVNPKSESPLSMQSSPLPAEERLSAWQRLKPAVKDQMAHFGIWLATQRQLHHVHSSPALFVGAGVALTSAPCLYSSQSVV